ncbi:MAG: RNA 2',3'-cyclic phosphodiesterase [Dehalococcoidales bacterium]
MEKIRSFIAVELPGELKKALAGLQSRFRSAGSPPLRWVEPGNIHITLKFLGDIDVDITGKITAALEASIQDIQPFSIEAGGLGVFPNMQRIQIIWVGLSGDLQKLGQLQKQIDVSLNHLGFPAEARPFTPHLTLARVRDYARPVERQKLGELISATGFEGKYRIDVKAVNLMRSQLTREGPIYSRISTVALK